MSSQIEELAPVNLGKNLDLRMFIDHSQPEDSIDHNYTELYYDGKEDTHFFQVPLHWHKDHDEYMEVLEGRMIFYLDGKEKVVSAGDPRLFIPRGHIHGVTCIKGERVRVRERTSPAGTFKALFFQDLFQHGEPGFLYTMRSFYDGDGYPSLPGGIKTLDWLFVSIFGFMAKAFVPARLASVKRLDK